MGMSEAIRVCRAVERLLKDRDENARFGDFPVDLTPPNLPEGYKVQDALIKRYQDRGQGIDGWKVGLASKSMQQSVGIPHPIEGPILESLSHNEHVDLSNADYVSVCLEADGLVLLAGPISYNEGPWTSETARERVGSVMVAIETTDDRLSKKNLNTDGLSIANFVHNEGCVLGPSIENWQETNLSAEKLSINLNEVFIGSGTDAAALDHPFNSVSWLANNLGRRRHNLHEGAIVLTGCVTEAI